MMLYNGTSNFVRSRGLFLCQLVQWYLGGIVKYSQYNKQTEPESERKFLLDTVIFPIQQVFSLYNTSHPTFLQPLKGN